MANGPPSISVADLACQRGGVEIFANVTFSLRAGQCGMLRGDNGAGKSSLLQTVGGLLAPIRGSVELTPGDPSMRHVLSTNVALKPDLPVRDQLLFEAALMSADDGRDALAAVGLAHTCDLPGRALSTGQRRRFAIARLVLDERPLWLLDEPTAGLDADGRALFRSLLADHLDAGGVALIASHDDIGLTPGSIVVLSIGAIEA